MKNSTDMNKGHVHRLVHIVQVIGMVTKCRELVNLILRQCKDVNDHVFKRFVSMPILKEELPSSLKTLKHVDIAVSGCSVHAVYILLQEWLVFCYRGARRRPPKQLLHP